MNESMHRLIELLLLNYEEATNGAGEYGHEFHRACK